MARKSTVAALPEELVQACNGLIREGRTIDEILAALHALGAPVSRSAVGRYVKGARDAMETYRKAQEMAKVWVGKVETDPDSDVGRLLSQMLHTIAYQTLSTMGESGEEAKPAEIMLLAKAIKDMAGTTKTNLDIAKQLRTMRAELKAVAVEVEGAVRQAGLSEDTVGQIKARILGVGERS